MANSERNELVSKPIPMLIRKIAWPAAVGFFFNTMYNVVDTFYAGLLSTRALAALSLSFPVFFLILAFGIGISTGATALISNALGAGKLRDAKEYGTQALSFAVLLSLVLTAIGLYASPDIFSFLGASGTYLVDALAYMDVIFLGTVFFLLTFVLNASLNATGNTKTFRNVLVIGFLMNIILDPWFMFGGLGLPPLGISGVAWATVVIQAVSAAYIGYRVVKTGLLCRECRHMFLPMAGPFRDIAKQGFPASLNFMTVALGSFVITFFVSGFGQAAVAAYGAALRIEQIALIPTIGINTAALVLVGQNFGAGDFERVRKTVRTALKYGAAILAMGAVLVFFFGSYLMVIFTSDPEVIDTGATYLKIDSFLFIGYLILFLYISVLQGLKKPYFAILIGIFRQLIIAIPVFIIFSGALGLVGIWLGILTINWVSAIITILYARHAMDNAFSGSAEKG